MMNATADKVSGTKGRKVTVTLPDGTVAVNGRTSSAYALIKQHPDGRWFKHGDSGSLQSAEKTAARLRKKTDIISEVYVIEVSEPTM